MLSSRDTDKEITISKIRAGVTLKKLGRFADDKEIVMEAVRADSRNFEFASDRLRDDREVVLAAIGSERETKINEYLSVYEDKRKTIEKVLDTVLDEPGVLSFAGEQARNDRAVVLAAVRKRPMALEFAGPELKNDLEIVLTALNIKKDGNRFRYNNFPYFEFERLDRCDRYEYYDLFYYDFFRLCKRDEADAFKFASDAMKDNRELMARFIERNGYMLRFASDRLKDDEDLVITAIKDEPEPFIYASRRLRDDKKFIAKAVIARSEIYPFIDDKHKRCTKFRYELMDITYYGYINISETVDQNGNEQRELSPDKLSEIYSGYSAVPVEGFFAKVMGLTFDDRLARAANLKPGEFLKLVREPHNKYDKNAVAVYSPAIDNPHPDGHLGYIRKELAACIAPLMDSGTELQAEIIRNKYGIMAINIRNKTTA